VNKGSPTLLEQGAVSILPVFFVTRVVLSTEPKLSKVAAFSGNNLDLELCCGLNGEK